MYNLVYYTNGRKIETTLFCAPHSVCKWKANILKKTTHRNGVFKIEKN